MTILFDRWLPVMATIKMVNCVLIFAQRFSIYVHMHIHTNIYTWYLLNYFTFLSKCKTPCIILADNEHVVSALVMLITIITLLFIACSLWDNICPFKKEQGSFSSRYKIIPHQYFEKLCQQFYFGLLNTFEDISCIAPLKRDKNYCGQQ